MYSIIFSWWWAVSCPKHVETYYKWNIYLLAASSWCSYISLYDARKRKTEMTNDILKKYRSRVWVLWACFLNGESCTLRDSEGHSVSVFRMNSGRALSCSQTRYPIVTGAYWIWCSSDVRPSIQSVVQRRIGLCLDTGKTVRNFCQVLSIIMLSGW